MAVDSIRRFLSPLRRLCVGSIQYCFHIAYLVLGQPAFNVPPSGRQLRNELLLEVHFEILLRLELRPKSSYSLYVVLFDLPEVLIGLLKSLVGIRHLKESVFQVTVVDLRMEIFIFSARRLSTVT